MARAHVARECSADKSGPCEWRPAERGIANGRHFSMNDAAKFDDTASSEFPKALPAGRLEKFIDQRNCVGCPSNIFLDPLPANQIAQDFGSHVANHTRIWVNTQTVIAIILAFIVATRPKVAATSGW